MNGYERIKDLYLHLEEKEDALKDIIRYLINLPNMSEHYLKEEKNLTELMSFINKKAKELAKNNMAMIRDSIVYGWATDYFLYSNEELGLTSPNIKIPNKEKEQQDESQLKLEI